MIVSSIVMVVSLLLRRTSTVKPASVSRGQYHAFIKACVEHARARPLKGHPASADPDWQGTPVAKFSAPEYHRLFFTTVRGVVVFRHRMQIGVVRFQRLARIAYSLPV